LQNNPEIVERDDGLFQIGLGDDAPCVSMRAFALRIASGYQPTPARNFRRIKIRKVRSHAPA
jgi:hypothetical protein